MSNNIEPEGHEIINNVYTKAQLLENDVIKEHVIGGIIDVARQYRVAEEIDSRELSECAGASKNAAEGVANITDIEHLQSGHAEQYREAWNDLHDDFSARQVEMRHAIPEVDKDGRGGARQQHIQNAEDARWDATVMEDIARATAGAYAASAIPLMEEYDDIRRKHNSRVKEGDEPWAPAWEAVDEHFGDIFDEHL